MAYDARDLAAQNIFFGDSGLAEDRFVTTWAFKRDTAISDALGAANVVTALKEFWTTNVTFPTVHKIVGRLGPTLNGEGEIRVYKLADPEPRVPILISSYTNFNNDLGSAGLPEEVALCMSFRALIASGSIPARRKGRVYIGPFAYATNIIATNGRPHADLYGGIMTAGDRLKDSATTLQVPWCVHSRADQALFPVVQGHVDNAWDTQRRRGLSPTLRSSFT